MSALLQAEGVHAGYGDVPVLRDLTLQVDEGEIVTLLGPNGAGKTTFLRVVTGLLSPSGGSVRFAGGQIAGSPPHQIVRRGIAMVPEGKQLWPQMTVWEHLLVPAASRRLSNDERERQRDFVFELFPVLRERRDSRAVTFSGGEQQMLAIARALMSRPQLLLLDEPSLGLAPRVVESVFKAIAQIRSEAAAVLLVEQNVRQALKLADRAYLMDQGSIYREGPAAELANVASADLARM